MLSFLSSFFVLTILICIDFYQASLHLNLFMLSTSCLIAIWILLLQVIVGLSYLYMQYGQQMMMGQTRPVYYFTPVS